MGLCINIRIATSRKINIFGKYKILRGLELRRGICPDLNCKDFNWNQHTIKKLP